MSEAHNVEEFPSKPAERPNLAAAVAAVMADVKRLGKDQDNKFANYRFTSVDDYKDLIRPLMAEHGLMACVSQVGFDTFEHETDKGKKSMHCRFDFELWLEHKSGEAGEHEGSTVCLPYTSAQTSGQARSYAMKEWLKSKFMASSGDTAEDADSFALDVKLTKAQARDVHAALIEELRDIGNKGDQDALNTWAGKNTVLLDAMPNDWTVELRHEYRQAQLQVNLIQKGVEATEHLPDVTKWKADFESEIRAATTEEDVDATWAGHEDTIESLIATDRAEIERIYRECMEAVNATEKASPDIGDIPAHLDRRNTEQ